MKNTLFLKDSVPNMEEPDIIRHDYSVKIVWRYVKTSPFSYRWIAIYYPR